MIELEEDRQITQESKPNMLRGVKVLHMPGKYTVAELARTSGIPQRKLCEYVNLGKLDGVKTAKIGRRWAIEWDGKTPLVPSWDGKHLLKEAIGITKVDQEFYCLNCNQHLAKKGGQVRQLYCSKKCRGQYVKRLNQQRRSNSKTPGIEPDGQKFNPANTFTIKELVKKSGIAEKTLHYYIILGKLEGIRAAKIKGIWRIEWDGKTPLVPSWNGKSLHPNLVTLGRLNYQRDDCLYCGQILIKKHGYKPQTWCSKQCQGRSVNSLTQQKIISSGGIIADKKNDNNKLSILPQNESESVNESEPVIDAYDVYMSEIKNIPRLSYEQTINLIKTYQEGVRARAQMWQYPSSSPQYRHFRSKALKAKLAAEQIIRSNSKLVISIARRYSNEHMHMLDLVQEGSMGLLKAMEKFDIEKDYQFSTYATWWIRQAITRTIANQARTIRIPIYVNENIVRLNQAKDSLLGLLDREGTEEELAKTLDWRVDKVRTTREAIYHYLSLSTPLSEDGLTVADFIADPENFEDEVDNRLSGETDEKQDDKFLNILENASLTELEKQVLQFKYGYVGTRSWTNHEIGQKIGISTKKVKRTIFQALEKLRTKITLQNNRL